MPTTPEWGAKAQLDYDEGTGVLTARCLRWLITGSGASLTTHSPPNRHGGTYDGWIIAGSRRAAERRGLGERGGGSL